MSSARKAASAREAIEEFDCFGSRCGARVIGCGRAGTAREAAALTRRTLLVWHRRFSRFLADSELSQLNGDPRETVPVRPLMARLAQAVRNAGLLSGGLVDATLVGELERAGYAHDLRQPTLALADALERAPARRPAGAAAVRRWREIDVDLQESTITRPPGLMLDSGGLAKGLFADVLGELLASHPSFAIDCAGDLLIGGAARTPRPIIVESPFDARTLHTFELSHIGVATSGIGRRSWLDHDGRPAHHLLDPSSGTPAFTGIVQVTALAPSALDAEIKAKSALLSGPQAAPDWLEHGGVIVFDDGSHRVLAPPSAPQPPPGMQPPPVVTIGQLLVHVRPRAAAVQEVELATGAVAA
jgi:thiamine biosynthesis lipoprotein